MRKRKREVIALSEEEESSASATEEPDTKKMKMDEDMPQPGQRAAFFTLLDDDYIQRFLASDSCYRISDKYLLAMVLTYFRRANLRTEEYSQYFFSALFLANQFEEDGEIHLDIFPWALEQMHDVTEDDVKNLRNQLLLQMGFKAWVDRTTCDLVMAQDPEHWAWKRERKEHHSWAIRWFRRDEEDDIMAGPLDIPLPCSLCNIIRLCMEEENIECQPDTELEPGTSDG
ncbi:speedy protein 1-B-like [Dendropsophus ebraccatus]|uniref:speedy protein 1-B-like n=1 Tax=Dendropsophus ebraccatus TaxID=150705 RepID=UPI0038315DEA